MKTTLVDYFGRDLDSGECIPDDSPRCLSGFHYHRSGDSSGVLGEVGSGWHYADCALS